MKLMLLGTVHRDPVGKHRLLAKLDELCPAVVSLEISPASVEIRQKQSVEWLKLFKKRLGRLSRETGVSPARLLDRANLRGAFEYIRLPYEYRAAAQWARDNQIPLFLLDDSELARRFLGRVETEILTMSNIKALAEAAPQDPPGQEVAAEYGRAARRIFNSNESYRPARPDSEDTQRREAELAQKISLLHKGLQRRAGRPADGAELAAGLMAPRDSVAYMPGRVEMPADGLHLYIGGWEHLVAVKGGRRLYQNLKETAPDRAVLVDPRP